MDVVAIRYSESLFELAKEENKVEKFSRDIEFIYNIFKPNIEFLAFFTSLKVSDQDKYQILEEAFKDSIDEYVLNFLKLLIKKRRFKFFYDIIEHFEVLTNKYLGIEKGFIYSSYKLDTSLVKKISEGLSKKLNKKVELEVKIDPSLIGGIKVVIGNRVYDDSIKNKLELMKTQLLRE